VFFSVVFGVYFRFTKSLWETGLWVVMFVGEGVEIFYGAGAGKCWG
jgi:hypothetical protein